MSVFNQPAKERVMKGINWFMVQAQEKNRRAQNDLNSQYGLSRQSGGSPSVQGEANEWFQRQLQAQQMAMVRDQQMRAREALRRAICATPGDAGRVTVERAASMLKEPVPSAPKAARAKPPLTGFDVTASGDHRPGLWRAVEG